MKEYILKPIMTPATLNRTFSADKSVVVAPPAPPVPARQPLPTATIDPTKTSLKLGLDVHLEFTMVVAQKGHGALQPPRKFTRAQLVTQVQKWIAEGYQVFCVQESCGFGFTLHRELETAGAQSFLMTPVALNGPRKTDKRDARVLCQRLSRWLDGDQHELTPIRIPSLAEQQKRDGTRRRKFLGRLIRMLANRGHGQGAEYLHESLPSRWWGPRNWKKLSALDPWVLEQLTSLRELILQVEAQLETLEAELVARVKAQERPKALGEITLVTLDGEVCDWNRFGNRKQIGSYTGCCPGEHSSGGQRRLGSIDRMGNGRVRTLLVEAVYRFLRWQPHWKAALRFRARLTDGKALKKKIIVALARLLAIDLWRWRTGRATLAELGWSAA